MYRSIFIDVVHFTYVREQANLLKKGQLEHFLWILRNVRTITGVTEEMFMNGQMLVF